MANITAARALSRFGLGARPGDLQKLAKDPRGGLLAELAAPQGVLLTDPALPQGHEAFIRVRAEALARKDKPPDPAMDKRPDAQTLLQQAEIAARIRRVLAVPAGYTERLVAFWANHFSVQSSVSAEVRAMAGAFEREAIRPFVLGRFADMLLAVTGHPAMLLSLDNANSIGPGSPAGLKRQRGLNENHAREILELHTVGVQGGYSQADVTAFARVLTGWGVARKDEDLATLGRFQFNSATHEPGSQMVMQVRYDQPDETQAKAVLADLAGRPETARHIAHKLARHFVADSPPDSLVAKLADRFQQTQGDLLAVSRALIEADEAWAAPADKIRLPQEFLWAAARALAMEIDVGLLSRALNALGQPVWNPPSPAGFADDSPLWLAPDALTTRLDIATDLAGRTRPDDPRKLAQLVLGESLSAPTQQAIERAESPAQGLVLLLMSPDFQRR